MSPVGPVIGRLWTLLRADPCRVAALLASPRVLRRLLRAWRERGTAALVQDWPDPTLPTPAVRLMPAPADVADAPAILVIDRALPRYDQDAGARSSFQYLRLFRDMGLTVYFLPDDQVWLQPYAAALESMGVVLLAGPGFRCGGWKRWVGANAGHLGVVFLHRPNVAPRYLRALRRLLPHATLCYCGHDLRHVRDARQYALTSAPHLLGESRYWEGVELAICRAVDMSYFFSEAETEAIRQRLPGAGVRTLPIFPDDAETMADDPPFASRAGILFVGGFRHQPNVDAVRWLVGELLPRLREALPAVSIHIVGAEPPADLLAWHGKGLVVEGKVSEARLAALYRGCRVAVAPLRFGAGVKGKVVEAMRHGLPMVTTPVGAEGIDDAAACLAVADTAPALAEQLIRLYTDRPAWEALHRRLLARRRQGVSRQSLMHSLAEDFRLSPPDPADRAAG